MVAFILGREGAISLAEIYSLFPQAYFIAVEKDFVIADNVDVKEVIQKYPNMGGSVKVVEILAQYPQTTKSKAECAIEYLTNV